MNTSIIAAINNITTATIIRFSESCSISQNFPFAISLLIIATLIIPPANAPVKYAAISGIPCIKYRANPNGRFFRLLSVNIPTAAAITLAFHDNMNIAPAPNISENSSVNINT